MVGTLSHAHYTLPTQTSTLGQERLTSGDLLLVEEGKLPPKVLAVHYDVIGLWDTGGIGYTLETCMELVFHWESL